MRKLTPNKHHIYGDVFKGWYKSNNNKYYLKSLYEWNYACYLDWLLSRGIIQSWEYEPETFWFHNIKRGVRSYTPDFKLVEQNGRIIYIEVKGYFDDKSITKLNRMKKYYPDITLNIIDKNNMKKIARWSKLIPNWKYSS